MQKPSILLILLSILLAPFSSILTEPQTFPEEPPQSCAIYNEMLPQFECSDNGQVGMNICSIQEFRYYDSILNMKYSRLMDLLGSRLKEESEFNNTELNEYALTKSYMETIIKSQRSWLKLRLGNEEVKSLLYNNGSMQPMAVNMQATSDTKHRICFLEDLLLQEDY